MSIIYIYLIMILTLTKTHMIGMYSICVQVFIIYQFTGHFVTVEKFKVMLRIKLKVINELENRPFEKSSHFFRFNI